MNRYLRMLSKVLLLNLLALCVCGAGAQTQSLTGSMITSRVCHTAALLNSGKVLVAGGQTYPSGGGAEWLASAELYNPQTGTFSSTGSLSAPRCGASSILLQNGTVLVYGGEVVYAGTDINVPATTAEIYNPSKGAFTVISASMTIYTATTLPSGKVLMTTSTSTANTDALQLFNPTTNTFSNTGLTTYEIGTATLLPNGTVLLTQGLPQGDGSLPYTVVSAENFNSPAEIYNPAANTLVATGHETGTDAAPAMSLGNGTVYFGDAEVWKSHSCTGVRGVCEPYAGTFTAPDQLYSMTTGTFTPTTSFTAVVGDNWTLLNDGNFLVYDEGTGSYYPYDTLQIYSPATGTASTAPTLALHDGSASITVLQNGTVLIAGGVGDNATTGVAELYGDPGVTGIIHPKYVVVGVTYAPPGPSSYVQYTNSTTLGTTTTLTNSLKSGESLSVSIGTSAGVPGWLDGSLTGTSTTSFTQETSNTNTVTVSEQASLAFKTPGTPNAFSPVNHDYDIIWLWLNPVIELTVNPNNPNGITWNGYGFDEADQPALDIWPIYVGYLDGDFGALDPEDATVLARSWCTGQTFPMAGQTPALTTTDYKQILLSDPFTSTSYTVDPTGNPPTTMDGRFTLSGGPSGESQAFPYKQAAPGLSPISETYTNVYTNLSTSGKSTTDTYEQAFSLDAKFNTGVFFDSLTISITVTGSLTLTSEALTTITNTAVQTDTLYIQGPPCTGTTSCNPAYVSPAEFDVYQDNIYGTFMFNPVN